MALDDTTMFRVVIADDHAMFRAALRLVLECEGGLRVVGEARDGDEAIELVRTRTPDVLLLDLAMPRAGGIDALRRLSGHPTSRAVLLTAAITSREIAEAFTLGVRGIVLKDAESAVLLDCVRTVARGGFWIGREHIRDLVEVLKRPAVQDRTPLETLTRREREVVAGVLEGASNRDIGLALRLSEQTVKNHLSHIYDKLGVSNRLELAIHATDHRLLENGLSVVSRLDDA